MGLVSTDDGRVILSSISWETYECLLKNYANQSTVRIAYDNGRMEILSPLVRHERDNRALQDIVTIILDAWEWDFVNAGSTTFKKDSAAKGFEPDTCFYLKNVDTVRSKENIDMEQGDAPPDLVMEIDLTASSLDRNPIFAAIGVPEVWRYARERLSILLLTEDGYGVRDASVALPGLTAAQIETWLTGQDTLRRAAWTRQIRAWAEANRPPSEPRSAEVASP